MNNQISELLSPLKALQRKMAFYPSLFAAFGFSLAFLLIYLETKGISGYLRDNFPALDVDSGGTALTILSACITGLISMMVFSFSMVMVLLNQASTNYSPRLLPGLVSTKSHQIILGIYLASLLYCMFIAVSVQPEGEDYQVPSFSVLLGILFTVTSFGAFISFIHNISQDIQVTTILDKIYTSGKERLNFLLKHENTTPYNYPDSTNWPLYHAEGGGYFQHLDLEKLKNICNENEVSLHILPVKGSFVLKGAPLARSSRKLDEESVNAIRSSIIFSRGELTDKNYAFAFKQITEIIIKAMSPGINDPGTALNGIDYMAELFALRMLKQDYSIITTKNHYAIKLNTIQFEDLMYNVMASIRTYCKEDIILVQQLSKMFFYLKEQKSVDSHYYRVVHEEANNLLVDAKAAIKNPVDQKVIERLEKKLNLKQ